MIDTFLNHIYNILTFIASLNVDSLNNNSILYVNHCIMLNSEIQVGQSSAAGQKLKTHGWYRLYLLHH